MSKKSFYGSYISDNIITTPEKYLICLGVPIARTGTQDYLVEEIFSEEDAKDYGLSYGEKITLHRRPEDLFKEEALRSYEGKSFTLQHPPDMVDVDNVYEYENGHVQNIRCEGEYVVGDIVVKDKRTIDAILDGTREISCGYSFDIVRDSNGDLYQTNFVGNHVALVNHGRAGSKVRIYDHEIEEKTMVEKKGSIFARMFKAFAKDADGEAIDEALEAITKDDDASEKNKGFMKGEEPNQVKDSPFEQRFAELEAKVDKILEVFAKADEKKAEVAAESAVKDAEATGEEPKDARDEASSEDKDKEPKDDEDSKKREVEDACSSKAMDSRSSTKGDMVYALIANRQKPKEVTVADLGDRIAKMYNPHYKENK